MASDRSAREKTLDPVITGQNPNSRAVLISHGIEPIRGGRPGRETRQKAASIFDEHLDLYEQILAKYRSGDPSVSVRDVNDSMDRLHKWAGRDVQKFAQTDSEGNDVATTLDAAALAAYVASLPSAIAERSDYDDRG